VASSNQQRRREERHAAPNVGLVELLVVTAYGVLKPAGRSLLYDQSRSGLSVVVDNAIPAGTELILRNRYVEYRGLVRHCQRHELGYKVGLLLQVSFQTRK